MWKGTSALKNIDQSLQTLRNDVVRLDTQLSRLADTLNRSHRQRLNIINAIARVRLEEIDSGELSAELSAADENAEMILLKRTQAMQALNEEIERSNEAIQSSEQARDGWLVEVNKASQKIVEIESLVQLKLEQDKSYADQLAIAHKAQSVAQEADQKVATAQADMTEKAEPYQADSLFMYLWEQGFGTTEYKSGLLTRFIDSWVAGLIKYEPARVNYWNLCEIPKRLEEHADGVNRHADEAHMALQQLELDALEAEGVQQAEAELVRLREALDSNDDELEASEKGLNGLLAKRALFLNGQDEFTLRSIERLSQALQHQDLASIHRYVRDTYSPTDDSLVIELQNLDQQTAEAKDDLQDLRSMHEAKLAKLEDLEQVRRDFKSSRFDDVRSGFGNEGLLMNVLAQFIQGAVSGSDLWKTLQRHQRYQNVGSLPDFGSGGLGEIGDLLGGDILTGGSRSRRRKQRRSTWHLPKPRRGRSGGGGFRLPRSSGRSSSGGFKTGGSF